MYGRTYEVGGSTPDAVFIVNRTILAVEYTRKLFPCGNAGMSNDMTPGARAEQPTQRFVLPKFV